MAKVVSPAATALHIPESTPLLAQQRADSLNQKKTIPQSFEKQKQSLKRLEDSRNFSRYYYFYRKNLHQRGMKHPGLDYFKLNSMIAGTEYVVYQEFAKEDDGSLHYEEIQDQRLRAVLLEYGRVLSAETMSAQGYLELEALALQSSRENGATDALKRAELLVDFWLVNMRVLQHLLIKLGNKISSQSTPLVERLAIDLLKSDGGFNVFVGALLIDEIIDSFGVGGGNAEWRLDQHRKVSKSRDLFFQRFTYINPDIESTMISHLHHLRTLSKDSLLSPRSINPPSPSDEDAPEAVIEGRPTSQEYRHRSLEFVMDGESSLPSTWKTFKNVQYWTELTERPPKVILNDNRRKHITIWLVLLRTLIYYLYYYGIVINFWRELQKDGIGRKFWLGTVFGLAPLSSFLWNWASNYLKRFLRFKTNLLINMIALLVGIMLHWIGSGIDSLVMIIFSRIFIGVAEGEVPTHQFLESEVSISRHLHYSHYVMSIPSVALPLGCGLNALFAVLVEPGFQLGSIRIDRMNIYPFVLFWVYIPLALAFGILFYNPKKVQTKEESVKEIIKSIKQEKSNFKDQQATVMQNYDFDLSDIEEVTFIKKTESTENKLREKIKEDEERIMAQRRATKLLLVKRYFTKNLVQYFMTMILNVSTLFEFMVVEGPFIFAQVYDLDFKYVGLFYFTLLAVMPVFSGLLPKFILPRHKPSDYLKGLAIALGLAVLLKVHFAVGPYPLGLFIAFHVPLPIMAVLIGASSSCLLIFWEEKYDGLLRAQVQPLSRVYANVLQVIALAITHAYPHYLPVFYVIAIPVVWKLHRWMRSISSMLDQHCPTVESFTDNKEI